MAEQTDLLIVLTTGKADRGTRATLAFSWGCTALAMGRRVALYATMDGSIWATRRASKGVAVGGFEPLNEYIDQFFDLGGELLVCAPCSQYYCSFDEQLNPKTLLEQSKLVGLATIVGLTGPGTKVITF